MKETIGVGLVAVISTLFFSVSTNTKEKEYEITVREIPELSTQDIIQQTSLYKRTEHIEQVADSFHIEVQKLRENEKINK